MNIQRSPGSPLPLPDWIQKGRVRQLCSYCPQNLAPKAEILFTHSEVAWGVQDSVDFLTLSPGGLWDSAENYKPLESVDFWKNCNIFVSRPKKILHTNLKFHHPMKRVGEGRSSRQMIMCATAHSSYASNWGGWGKAACSVVHPDPAGSEIICKLGSGSVINSWSDSGSGFGFVPGSKLSSASN
jgi:hypothetical protein